MPKYKFSYKDTKKFSKYGVNISSYEINNKDANVVYEAVEEGHFEEFLHTKSAFIWFIISGRGIFVINDKKIPVNSKDIIVLPPNNRVHYFGKMKMLLLTVPAFKPEFEKHIRNVKKEENPFLKNKP